MELTRVAVYRRTVGASLERVWENVLDWEHLPWLHRTSFAEIEAQEAGEWGWRARAVTRRGSELQLELRVEREASRYVSRTLEGEGAGTEIWTQLRVRAQRETDVEVAFYLPDVSATDVKPLGAAYVKLYTTLWDEDEEMMRERQTRLCSRRAAADAEPDDMELNLGRVASLRAKLPLRIEFAGEPVWLVERDGELRVHSAICPHLLGPLPPVGGGSGSAETIECPWHGYRFDAITGANCDGRRLRLKDAPQIAIENGEVRLLSRANRKKA